MMQNLDSVEVVLSAENCASIPLTLPMSMNTDQPINSQASMQMNPAREICVECGGLQPLTLNISVNLDHGTFASMFSEAMIRMVNLVPNILTQNPGILANIIQNMNPDELNVNPVRPLIETMLPPSNMCPVEQRDQQFQQPVDSSSSARTNPVSTESFSSINCHSGAEQKNPPESNTSNDMDSDMEVAEIDGTRQDAEAEAEAIVKNGKSPSPTESFDNFDTTSTCSSSSSLFTEVKVRRKRRGPQRTGKRLCYCSLLGSCRHTKLLKNKKSKKSKLSRIRIER